VFGVLADKDLQGIFAALADQIQHWALAPLPTPRTRAVAEVQAALLNRGAAATVYTDVAAALEGQCERAGAEDEILLFGSFYCVAEALNWLTQHTEGERVDGLAG